MDLARALAADTDGLSSRLAEALDELNAALSEPGGSPSEAEIHLLSAQLSERQDPSAALQSYITALGDPKVAQAAAGGALAMIAREPEGPAAVSRLSRNHVDLLRSAARADHDPTLCVLAGRILRLVGSEDEALGLLQDAAKSLRQPPRELLAEMANLLLDLDRVDDVLALVTRSGPGHDLDCLAARAHLLRGEYDQALQVLDNAPPPSNLSEITVLRALALTGLGNTSEALDSLRGDDSATSAAATIVALVGQDYEAARKSASEFLRSAPTDPSALILDAQVALEDLEPSSTTLTPDHSLAEQFRTRQALLKAAVGGTAVSVDRLWWLKLQRQLRADDGRFQFFWLQLRTCRGEKLLESDWSAVDASTTTYAQDAVIAESIAKLIRERGPADEAAKAYVNALMAWQRDEVRDGKQAYQCAQTAYKLDPNADHAADLAYALVFDTYRTQDLHLLSEAIDETFQLSREWMREATDDSLMTLTCGNAWLAGRQFEIAERDKQRLGLRAVQWLVLAVGFQRSDAALNSLLASILRTLGHGDAALHHAQRALDESRTDFTVSTMIVCLLDGSEHAAALELLDDPALEAEPAWSAAIALASRLYQGDVDDVQSLIDVGLDGVGWARSYVAMSVALGRGLAAAEPLATQAIDRLGEFEGGFDEILLAGVFQPPEVLSELYRRALASGNLSASETDMCEVIVRWIRDPHMSLESAAKDFLAVAPRWCDVEQFMNVDAPLIIAAKSGVDRPAKVSIDPSLLHECQERLARDAQVWADKLDQLANGLSAVVPLGDMDTFTADVIASGAAAVDALADPDLKRAAGELVQRATSVSLGQVLRRQVRWCVGKGRADDVGVELLLDPERDSTVSERIAALVVSEGRSELLGEIVADSSPDDLAEAGVLVTDAARAEVDSPAEFWSLMDSLSAKTGDDRVSAVIAGLRSDVLSVLAGTLQLRDDTRPELRSPFSFILGTEFVPEDTGPDWELFTDLVPAMKARINAETGYEMPGCSVRADYGAGDALWLLINGGAHTARRLPTSGWIALAREVDAVHYRDPVTGDPLTVTDSQDRPPLAWSPLEFMMRHVEQFARDTVPSLISFWDIRQLFADDDPTRERLLSDPELTLAAMDTLREAVRAGRFDDTVSLRLSLEALVKRESEELRG